MSRTPGNAVVIVNVQQQSTAGQAPVTAEVSGQARDLLCYRQPLTFKAVREAGGDPNIIYYHSYWQLAPDEALVIDATPPACETWNFQLDNHWLESLDYRYFQIHVNKHTATYRDDGAVRVIVAHQDPGLPNWINTVGHDRGAMTWRWIRANEHPQPQTRVVKFSELNSLQ